MSQEGQKQEVFVAGIYNWPASLTKEQRHKDKNYPRYNWADIDTPKLENHDAVLNVFRKYGVSCIAMRCGKGYHFFGDLLPFDLWFKVWNEIKPYCDPLWAPHTIRISKKRKEERFDKPIFYDNDGLGIKPWMKAVMSFMCKAIREENSGNLFLAMKQCGIPKYFQGTVYKVELK